MAYVDWMIKRPKIASCNCAYGCPCELNAPPHNDRAPDGKPYRTVALKENLRPLRLGLLQLDSLRPTRLAQAFADHCRSAAGEKRFPFQSAGDVGK